MRPSTSPGNKHGRWTVIEKYKSESTDVRWLCECSCGNRKPVSTHYLLSGKSKSCGCYAREVTSITKSIHKQSNNRLYVTWMNMKSRCYYSKNLKFNRYGGRGITICDDWKDDFLAFSKWAIESGYEEGLTIERKDFNGNYEPSNCKWISKSDQQKNKKSNRPLTINGVTKLITDWEKLSGVTRHTILSRFKNGIRDEDLIRKGRLVKKYGG